MLKRISFALILCLALFFAVFSGCETLQPAEEETPFADDPLVDTSNPEIEVNYLDLAETMVLSGQYDKADTEIQRANIQKIGFDFKKYYTLRGIIAINNNLYRRAIGEFRSAVDNGQDNPNIYIYLAQAYFGSGDYKSTISAFQNASTLGVLDNAGDLTWANPSRVRMLVECHWRLDQRTEAFNILEKAEAWFPERLDFTEQKILYLINMGLYTEATTLAEPYLRKAGHKSEAYVAVGEALRRSKQFDRALRILETGKLKFPDNDRLIYSLAHTYMDSGRNLAAAELFEEASLRNADFLSEAVDLFRKAGRHERALYLNREVRDQKVKARQRLGILLDLEQFEKAVAHMPRLSRLGLLDDDKISYAAAYAYFKVGRYDKAEILLSTITAPGLLSSVDNLRKAIGIYRKTYWLTP